MSILLSPHEADGSEFIDTLLERVSVGVSEPADTPIVTIDSIGRSIVGASMRLIPASSGSVMQRHGRALEVVYSRQNPAALGSWVAFGDAVSGKVAAAGEAQIVSGHVCDRAVDVDSALCLPLWHGGEVVGVLNLNAPSDVEYAKEHLEEVLRVVAPAAAALAFLHFDLASSRYGGNGTSPWRARVQDALVALQTA